MRKILLVACLLFATAPAFAQQSPKEQALASKLLNEININLQCSEALIVAQARIRALEEKYENKDEKK